MANKLPYTKSEAKAWGKATIRDWYDCPCTPFKKDDSLDEAGLRGNVEQLIGMGESGLVLGGFVAECWNITVTEWIRHHLFTSLHLTCYGCPRQPPYAGELKCWASPDM